MSDDDEQLEALLRDHFTEEEAVSAEAVETAASLFGLRRIDEELIELAEQELAMRSDDEIDAGSELLRFEFDDVTVLVRPTSDGIEVIVSPPDTEMSVESAAGARSLDLDESGVAHIQRGEPMRLRIERPNGTSGMTDGFSFPD